MLKIFSTQLNGVIKRIQEQEEMHIEEAGRLLAQATIGQGFIYIKGFDEVSGLYTQLLFGEEKNEKVLSLTEEVELTSADRVILIAPTNTHKEACAFARELQAKMISTVSIAATIKGEQGIEEFVDMHIDTKANRGLIPAEDGSRIGKPSVIASSFILHALQFVISEIMEDYE